MKKAFHISGLPSEKTVLIVLDHASNRVPDEIDLQISPDFLNDHIAIDIGVTEIAEFISQTPGYIAYEAAYSRLVVDLNRTRDEEAIIPQRSDGVEIPGNVLNADAREERLVRYFDTYHARLAELIVSVKPALIIALHSFTNVLRSDHNLERPWDMGIMYNEQVTASKLALQSLAREDLVVGDQKPYSGKLLNATMNRHAEAHDIPYFGVEIRQDLIANESGQTKFAKILMRTAATVLSGLA